MTAYRLYKIDGSGGFVAAEWIDAESDEAALDRARAQAGAFELWHRSRLVGRSGPEPLGGDEAYES